MTQELELVTVVTESLLRDEIVKEARKLGAKGFTFTQVDGQGSRGVRASEWEGRNVKIETVVSPDTAKRIIDHIAKKYFEHYAVIVYSHSVRVVRSDKYS